METIIYVINADSVEDFYNLTDREIKEIGTPYTLKEFEEAINSEDLELCNSFIKIL